VAPVFKGIEVDMVGVGWRIDLGVLERMKFAREGFIAQ